MTGLYYRIWADAIVSQKEERGEHTSWKLYTMVPMSVLQGINLFTIFYWLRLIVNRGLLLMMPVDIFSARPLNGFISVIITFFIPFILLNYLLIFNNNKYKKLIENYNSEGGKLYRKYALSSIALAIIPIVVKVMFFE